MELQIRINNDFIDDFHELLEENNLMSKIEDYEIEILNGLEFKRFLVKYLKREEGQTKESFENYIDMVFYDYENEIEECLKSHTQYEYNIYDWKSIDGFIHSFYIEYDKIFYFVNLTKEEYNIINNFIY